MDYSITESKLKKVFYSYMDSNDEYNNLKEFDGDFFDWDSGTTVEAIDFGQEDHDPKVIYYKYPSDPESYKGIEMLEVLPSLTIVDSNFTHTMKSFFGELFEPFFLDWFKDRYGYESNNVF